MSLVCVLFCCMLASSLLMVQDVDAPSALAFQEDFGEDALERWLANSAKLAVESDADLFLAA